MQNASLHIIERKVAIKFNLLKYFTCRPCKYGHISERYTAGFACIACIKLKTVNDADKKREYDRAYREANKERLVEIKRIWTAENKDKVLQIKRDWKKRNPEYMVADAQKRRAAKRSAEGDFSHHDVIAILGKQSGKCANCTKMLKKKGKHRYHVDHVMPLARGGSNWPSNLQILCPPCNLKKNDKHPLDWAQENGRLL